MSPYAKKQGISVRRCPVFQVFILNEAEILHRFLKLLLVSRLKLGERGAKRARLDADILECGLDRDRVDLGEEGVDEGKSAELELTAAGDVPIEELLHDLVGLTGATFERTEITPSPPRERSGTTWSSFPE